MRTSEEIRQDFMEKVYSELHDDGDNYRANRIIDAFDEAIAEEFERSQDGQRG